MGDLFRLVTVHPALVHFALGPLPIVVAAYAVATFTRSERWAFVGDVTLTTAAILTVAALSFGVVSNALLAWPGGFDQWRWLHVGFGIASTVVVVGLCLARLLTRRRAVCAGSWVLGASVVASVLMLLTAWIGGEVLVFRSGMAVQAAANGSLAPTPDTPEVPHDLLDSMGRLRGAWAHSTTRLASMIVVEPRSDDYSAISRDAERMQRLALWIEGNADRYVHDPAATPAHESDARLTGTDHVESMEAHHVAEMGRELGARAASLAEAARRGDLQAAIAANGSIEALCAHCHDELRWAAHHEH
jgi:uncharacterized membrane protein